jgi:uncharacterized protein (DUF2267 family)
MNFDEFTGQVQHRLELPGTGEAVRAIRATLTTLGERIQAGEARDLAASLPMEVDYYLTDAVAEHGQRFDWSTFVERVREREGIEDGAAAAYHARVVLDVAAEVVAPAEIQQVRDQLPADEGWKSLFELVDAD